MFEEPEQFIAMQECSNGNATVGDMWIWTATFPPDTPISEIWKWAKSGQIGGGRLMIQSDEKARD